MGLGELLQRRLESDGPVRAGLIGAGKFGSMFLSQIPTSPGLEVAVIADLNPQRAREACAAVGWGAERIGAVRFTDDGAALAASPEVDVAVEATGDPAAGVSHARAAFRAGKHVVMVNVEADALAGPRLAREAASAGVVYSMAYGDQPALICELVDWARSCGFAAVAAGKGTKYLPSYHASTPDTVWDFYGLTAERLEIGGLPIGLARGVRLTRDVPAGAPEDDEALRARRETEQLCKPERTDAGGGPGPRAFTKVPDGG